MLKARVNWKNPIRRKRCRGLGKLYTTDLLGTQDSRLLRGEEVGDPLSGSYSKTDKFHSSRSENEGERKTLGTGLLLTGLC